MCIWSRHQEEDVEKWEVIRIWKIGMNIRLAECQKLCKTATQNMKRTWEISNMHSSIRQQI